MATPAGLPQISDQCGVFAIASAIVESIFRPVRTLRDWRFQAAGRIDMMVTQHTSIGVAGPRLRAARPAQLNLALLRAFRRSPIEFLDLLVAGGASEGPVRFGPERVLLMDDPTEVWELLTVHTRRTRKGRGLVRARMLLGDGLLTSEGEEHLRQRRALQAAFHPQRISGYLESFASAARHAVDRWSDGGEIDLVAEMSGLTLDGVGTALFGTDLRGSTPQITRALAALLTGFRLALAPGGVWLIRSPLPAARRTRQAKSELDNVVDDLIRHRSGEPGAASASVRPPARAASVARRSAGRK